MMIDFEKAFDYISIYFCTMFLNFLASSPGFIHWVKLLNTDVHSSVIQAEVKSDTK